MEPLHIAVVSCAFPPDLVVTAGTSCDIAAALARHGHAVKVIAPYPSRPRSLLASTPRSSLLRLERSADGYDVVRCLSFVSKHSTMLSRLLENVSFGMVALLALFRVGRQDVVYANTWPVFATFALAAYCRLRRIPFLLNIQDVYPESLEYQNRIAAAGRTSRILKRLDTWNAKQAASIVVPSPSFRRIYTATRGVDPSQIIVVPNWNRRTESIAAADPGAASGARRLSKRDFAFAYWGNIGVACGLLEILPWFRQIPGSFQFTIGGEGDTLADCRSVAATIPAGRIRFQVSQEEMRSVLDGADVLILPTRGDQALASIPSKLIAYMMAGKPVISIARGDSDLAGVIRSAACGWNVEPGDRAGFRALLARVQTMPGDVLADIGGRGRDYAMRHYSADGCVTGVLQLVEGLGSSVSPRVKRCRN